ncbi:hypothetical protein Acr_21g0010670 [Actinidia rufa]|uniref:Uncharacterized protein n=1 Tax=Actinidia rufa TaxID=165716 RepID=A0A7J0GIA7_9ERIC|nr:hypothetical protein Acr_21g0010670 [Actinidia rufa]
MHFQIEVPAPSHVGVMQPPTGVQKRERVLCLPLARSALPCRLTRHSALGTVRLCPVGLARHSTPGMVLVIKCSSLAAKYCHCVRMALLSWLCTIGSAQLALHGWLCSVGSTQLALRLALLSWLCSVGSARLALLSWLCLALHVGSAVGSARWLALLSWLCSVGSAQLALTQLALHGWLCTVGSATMYGTGYQNAVRNCPIQHGGCQMQLTGCPSNAVRNCSNAALNAARCNLRVARISFKHVYGLTVGAIKYGMQDICIKQVRAHCCSKHVPNAANYCCQTYAVLEMLRQTQLSAYCQNICSSRNTVTLTALGILPESPPYFCTYPKASLCATILLWIFQVLLYHTGSSRYLALALRAYVQQLLPSSILLASTTGPMSDSSSSCLDTSLQSV